MPKRGSKLLGKQKEKEQVQEVQVKAANNEQQQQQQKTHTHTLRKFLWWPSLRMRNFLAQFSH